jgi:hypothetical protein
VRYVIHSIYCVTYQLRVLFIYTSWFQQIFNDPKYGRKYQDTTDCVIHSFVTLILLVLVIFIFTNSISAPHVNSIGAPRHLPKHSKGQGNMFVLQSLLVVLFQVPPSVFCSTIFRHRTSHWQVLFRPVALCQA